MPASLVCLIFWNIPKPRDGGAAPPETASATFNSGITMASPTLVCGVSFSLNAQMTDDNLVYNSVLSINNLHRYDSEEEDTPNAGNKGSINANTNSFTILHTPYPRAYSLGQGARQNSLPRVASYGTESLAQEGTTQQSTATGSESQFMGPVQTSKKIAPKFQQFQGYDTRYVV